MYLLTVRRNQEAVAAARRARALSPLAVGINVELATALVRVGRYDEAIAQLHKTLELNRRTPARTRRWPRPTKGRVTGLEPWPCSRRRFHYPEGRPTLARVCVWDHRAAARGAGNTVAARDAFPRALRHAPGFAVVHLGLGDKDQAFAWLEKAYEDRAFEVGGFSGLLSTGWATTRGSRTCCAG